MKHWLNDRIVDEAELLIPARDIGFLRGYAVFDFLITYKNRPFRLSDHLDRLLNSATHIKLHVPYQKSQIEQWVNAALAANEPTPEKSIRIVLSGGVGADSITPNPDKPTCIVFIDPFKAYPEEFYTQGTGITLVEHMRYTPLAKSNNYIEGVMRIREAHAVNAVEPVYHSDNLVYEGATSNIFAVIDGTLRTPKLNVLAGVTRKVLLEILDVPVVVDDITVDELKKASEVFLTASNKEIMPITTIDGTPVGNGNVGVVTKHVMAEFRKYVESGNW